LPVSIRRDMGPSTDLGGEMKSIIVSGALAAILLSAGAGHAEAYRTREPAEWAKRAERVTITRDNWGIAHIKGKTDADAVFGMIYAQAEDDFNRIETNYLISLGYMAQAEGESAIWSDLRARLYVDDQDLMARYDKSPAWLKTLMTAWSDGLNYYLLTHPDVKPRVITRFEPWMALSFSEGSIGGDIESVSESGLADFYGQARFTSAQPLIKEPSGSNGFAVAPQNTVDGHALLWINPHTTFFFRSEAQVTSDTGLNVYGASTWGQFFVYQGFNEHAGWMHTSSGLDVIDEFAETIVRKDGKLFYKYGSELRPIIEKPISVRYRKPDGSFASRSFTTYRTHHGPVVRTEGDKWISVAMMFKPVEALSQSFLRTKASDYASFRKVAELQANSSNNTIFADSKGEIAYLHPSFIPRRNDQFDYTRPVDGANPATDWGPLHALNDAPGVLSPPNGWIANTNDWPYSAAGNCSPKRENYPRYMDSYGPNPRGEHARLILSDRKDFTPERLNRAAYDSLLPGFAATIPLLVADWERLDALDPRRSKLAEPIALLKAWDYRWGVSSIPTSLAVFWGDDLWEKLAKDAQYDGDNAEEAILNNTSAKQRLASLSAAVDRLNADFGNWKTPWGDINRLQRINGDLHQPFNDSAPSLAVPFTSAAWGSLASFGAKRYEGTKRYYGTSGNSFIAVVEFGPRLKAFALSAGGESGNPSSPHFNDQASLYPEGKLRPVYFYPDDLKSKTESQYHPGGRH
jgi:acyl-homoserine-lactone acylase